MNDEIQYIDCRVTIHDNEHASYEDEYKRSVQESTILEDALTRRTIEQIRHWVEASDQCNRDDLILLGEHLYNLLFHGDIGKEFELSYQLFTKQRKENRYLRLRLTLIFHRNADALATYPWEFLYMRSSAPPGFLAGQIADLILTRFVPETGSEETLKEHEEPLRILVACSSPSELGDIKATEIINAIKDLACGQIEVEVVENQCRSDLKNTIREFKPHVFHFIGHGKAGKIALIADTSEIEHRELRGDRTESDWCDNETISDLFAEHTPRLVFLHACKGAASFERSLQSFTSTARELVYQRIPAVIGMQFAIENEDASTFAKCFYLELAKGNPVDEAVTVARRKLGSMAQNGAWADSRFGSPLIYLQVRGPIIIAPHVPVPVLDDSQVSYECPSSNCPQKVKSSYISCPRCSVTIARCSNGHPVRADWSNCPYCSVALRPGAAMTTERTALLTPAVLEAACVLEESDAALN
jgi:hypothetical protein